MSENNLYDPNIEIKVEYLSSEESDEETASIDPLGEGYRDAEMVEHEAIDKNGDKIFCCILCHKRYSTVANLKSHIKQSHLRNHLIFVCRICGKGFKTFKKFRKHFRKRHECPGDDVTCVECDKRFGSDAALLKHIETVHPKPGMSRSCPVCGGVYKTKAALGNHMRHVHPKEEDTVICMFCGKTCKTKKVLREHVQIVHTTEKDIVTCEHCNINYKSKKSLSVHNRKFHNKRGTVIFCALCNRNIKIYKLCSAGDAVSNHDFLYCRKCYDECVPKLPNSKTRTPRIIHIKENESVCCSICFQTIELNHVLLKRGKRPIRVITAEELTCHVCGKQFKYRKTLRDHVGKVHSNASDNAFCSHCNKQFKTKSSLKVHNEEFHEGKHLCFCPVCRKKFLRKQNLKVHLEKKHKIGLSDQDRQKGDVIAMSMVSNAKMDLENSIDILKKQVQTYKRLCFDELKHS